MKEVKVLFLLVVGIIAFGLVRIIVVFIFDIAAVAVPSDRHGADAMNEWFEDESDRFAKKAYKSDAERNKARNEAGLFYNPETGEWEEDPDKYSRYLDAKYGYNPERNK